MTSWPDWETDAGLSGRTTRISVLPRDSHLDATLAQQQREISALCASVAHLETSLEEAHRLVARQAATIARLRRRGPRAWEWALAVVVCALERGRARLEPWYSFERGR